VEVAPDRVRGLHEPYDRNLISAQLRLAYCVRGVDPQKNNLAELKPGSIRLGLFPRDVDGSHAA